MSEGPRGVLEEDGGAVAAVGRQAELLWYGTWTAAEQVFIGRRYGDPDPA